jgi:hypothetical protein
LDLEPHRVRVECQNVCFGEAEIVNSVVKKRILGITSVLEKSLIDCLEEAYCFIIPINALKYQATRVLKLNRIFVKVLRKLIEILGSILII